MRHDGQPGRQAIGAPIGLGMVLVAAFGLRLAYLLHGHPFFDEFSSLLAAQAILRQGVPILPSGLFYEHGLFFTYLATPFVALAGWLAEPANPRPLFILARLPSLVVGVVTVLGLYRIGRRWLAPPAGLAAAALLAFSPEGMVWGGRARMYALGQLLTLLLAFFAYQGSLGAGRPRWRWLAWLMLLLALLTQFGAIILAPAVVLGMLVVAWFSRPPGQRPWFWRARVLPEVCALIGVVALAVVVKRAGQPLGASSLASLTAAEALPEVWNTISYQAGLALDGESALKFLTRQFGVPHHLLLTSLAVLGGGVALAGWLGTRPRGAAPSPQPGLSAYLWLVMGVPVLEMITLLEPWRRNPRYLVIILPCFYLVAIDSARHILDAWQRLAGGRWHLLRRGVPWLLGTLLAVAQAYALWLDGAIAYRTPEPAYEEAFQYLTAHRQPDDILLTMNTSAAGVFGQRVDYFAIQQDAAQFLINKDTQPVDRWLGAPWLGDAAEFQRVVNQHATTWFMVDTIRLPLYYQGDWLAVLKTQLEPVWSGDEVRLYRTRSERGVLPAAPNLQLNAELGGRVRLLGWYQAQDELARPGSRYPVTLFWQPLAAIQDDYTVFIHLRTIDGAQVAQRDAQPLDGDYPTQRWRLGETVIDPQPIPLPPDLAQGVYVLWAGMYRLDTLERLSVKGDRSGENAVRLGQLVVH